MDVTLRYSACRVPEKTCDRQFREAEIPSHAGESVSKNVGRHFLQVGLPADSIQDSDDPNEMTITPVGRDHEGLPSRPGAVSTHGIAASPRTLT